MSRSKCNQSFTEHLTNLGKDLYYKRWNAQINSVSFSMRRLVHSLRKHDKDTELSSFVTYIVVHYKAWQLANGLQSGIGWSG